eukprot:CAMPEP_0174852130 /NCGR_PEP_ID=MMETSP1114-20130205/25205_1 /TAXON_ID=312471 /ORGANISM="Neobodo designis, Strain CCAP 1951/1" /LENGTH=105 /DNA_ID=CAMNT_0016086709 /DNA_START=38 /DNA_END=352 /DNA_ORIENTATION=-
MATRTKASTARRRSHPPRELELTKKVLHGALRGIADVAGANTLRYIRAHASGTPIPPPRSDAAYRAVRRYDTADPEPKTVFHSKRPAPLPVVAVFENLAKRVPTF